MAAEGVGDRPAGVPDVSGVRHRRSPVGLAKTVDRLLEAIRQAVPGMGRSLDA